MRSRSRRVGAGKGRARQAGPLSFWSRFHSDAIGAAVGRGREPTPFLPGMAARHVTPTIATAEARHPPGAFSQLHWKKREGRREDRMNGELCLLWRTNQRTNAFFFPSFASNLRNNIVRLSFRSILRSRTRARKNAAGVIITPACVRTKKGSRRGDAHAGIEVIVGVRTWCSDVKLHNNPNLVYYQICSILQYIFYILQYRILNLRGARRRRGGPHRLEPKERGAKFTVPLGGDPSFFWPFRTPYSLTRSPARSVSYH